KTGLSLRTIQRIENGETEPRGDSLKKLALTFDVSSDEIIDWTVKEDKGVLTNLNLSALSFIIFPILGILVPLIIWISKKDKIKNVNTIAKDLLNFQITWTMLLFVGYFGIILSVIYKMRMEQHISPAIISPGIIMHYVLFGIMYLYNIALIIINRLRINNNKKVGYYPKIRFLRK